MFNLVKKLSHCSCDKLTPGHRGSPANETSWVERLLLRIIPHFDIVKTAEGPNGTEQTVLYLRRFYLWRSKWIGLNFGELYIHHIVRPDDDQDPHDHPWSFLTFILKGGYTDEQWLWIEPIETLAGSLSGFRVSPSYEEVLAPDIKYRPAKHIHRVLLPEGKDAWTLVLATGYRRDWYFVTKDGPVLWREYLDVWDDNGS